MKHRKFKEHTGSKQIRQKSSKVQEQRMSKTHSPSTETYLCDPSASPWTPNWLSPFSLVLLERGCELFVVYAIATVVGTSSSISCMLKTAELQEKFCFRDNLYNRLIHPKIAGRVFVQNCSVYGQKQ